MNHTIPKTMRAVLLTAYNRLELREIPVPVPAKNEVLCKIKAVAICGSDPQIIRGERPREWPQNFPHILGHEWAGEVVALGEGVTDFQIGDRVAGEAHSGCGYCKNCLSGNYTICLNYGKPETGARHYGFNFNGANCEYNAYTTKSIHKIPDSLSFEHASLSDICGVAMHCIELVGVTPSGTVAVIGPGPAGVAAMQIVKGLGAANAIMIGRGSRLQNAVRIGVDYAVDINEEDPVEAVRRITNGFGVDEVFECSGASVAPVQAVKMVKRGGRIGLIGHYHDTELKFPNLVDLISNEISIHGSRANPGVSEKVISMISRGIIKGDTLVTHRFPLEQYEEALDVF
ncbi:MAG: alcohol dehydrogenase catalytic domain-containing protein, partial [Oscillospiraceae bacterium]|nr:alcohol dehydrogenase catalytic domain-containing protein [Oscillospiraceae bacterium]